MRRRFHATHNIRRAALLYASLLVTAAPALAQRAAIYPDPSVARTQINDALSTARREHKRVILDFGGNWCGDCQVLNMYFHDAANLPILEKNFELVDVNIGRFDANKDIAGHYGIPLEKGVPALVILSSDGKVLLAQTHGEFESMRHLQSSDLTAFLNQWKPNRSATRGGS